MVGIGVRMKVYLDDVRETPDGWTRTYTVDQTIELLKSGEVVELSLDHDLGKDKDGNDLTDGYYVLPWIEKEVALNGFVPPKMHIHSANAAAWPRMKAAIQQIEKLHERNLPH
jgi:hypothetical protein